MDDYTQDEIIEQVYLMQSDRDHMRELLQQVCGAVLDRAPDGVTVAYLDRCLLTEIRRTVTP